MKRSTLLLVLCIVFILGVYLLESNNDQYQEMLKARDYYKITRIKEAETVDIIRCYQTTDGIVQIVNVPGYKGIIEIMVVIKEQEVNKVEILSHSETPDYGGYITEEWFLTRLLLPIDNELKLVKIAQVNANEVVAVTGATISSQSVVDGVNLCIRNIGGIRK